MNNLILTVDEQDRETGALDKFEVHRKGILHRAFSLFIFNSRNEMLLQQRAPGKYHSGGLWTNSCCSHALPGEVLETTVRSRLAVEMGISCEVKHLFTFHYRTQFDNGLIENEIDHVYAGVYEGDPLPDPEEAASWRWVHIDELASLVEIDPERYTVWFRLAYKRVIQSISASV